MRLWILLAVAVFCGPAALAQAQLTAGQINVGNGSQRIDRIRSLFEIPSVPILADYVK